MPVSKSWSLQALVEREVVADTDRTFVDLIGERLRDRTGSLGESVARDAHVDVVGEMHHDPVGEEIPARRPPQDRGALDLTAEAVPLRGAATSGCSVRCGVRARPSRSSGRTAGTGSPRPWPTARSHRCRRTRRAPPGCRSHTAPPAPGRGASAWPSGPAAETGPSCSTTPRGGSRRPSRTAPTRTCGATWRGGRGSRTARWSGDATRSRGPA